jgi:hypothetical protein
MLGRIASLIIGGKTKIFREDTLDRFRRLERPCAGWKRLGLSNKKLGTGDNTDSWTRHR